MTNTIAVQFIQRLHLRYRQASTQPVDFVLPKQQPNQPATDATTVETRDLNNGLRNPHIRTQNKIERANSFHNGFDPHTDQACRDRLNRFNRNFIYFGSQNKIILAQPADCVSP